ncbi:unnamed protein product [Onchocerca flexuosa]|uniref:Protein kinase domain-containing protein n=1 Tax=Onchocerca flexuosa TaxID=387005 RepID=A0A183I1J5_9BILA|nr:unnamed protein product [Onchocerca flexuosa]
MHIEEVLIEFKFLKEAGIKVIHDRLNFAKLVLRSVDFVCGGFRMVEMASMRKGGEDGLILDRPDLLEFCFFISGQS